MSLQRLLILPQIWFQENRKIKYPLAVGWRYLTVSGQCTEVFVKQEKASAHFSSVSSPAF